MLFSSRADIQIGDLVEKVDSVENKLHGVVCQRSVHHPECDNSIVFIAEVLWDSGQKGWIDECRIRVISKDRM